MQGFSLAYLKLEAGTGALNLFGGVQITMFAGAVLAKEAIAVPRGLWAAQAFAGLVLLMLPAVGAVPSQRAAALMLIAAIGWGIYSLAGRRAADPLAATATNFVWRRLPLVGLPCSGPAPQGPAQRAGFSPWLPVPSPPVSAMRSGMRWCRNRGRDAPP